MYATNATALIASRATASTNSLFVQHRAYNDDGVNSLMGISLIYRLQVIAHVSNCHHAFTHRASATSNLNETSKRFALNATCVHVEDALALTATRTNVYTKSLHISMVHKWLDVQQPNREDINACDVFARCVRDPSHKHNVYYGKLIYTPHLPSIMSNAALQAAALES